MGASGCGQVTGKPIASGYVLHRILAPGAWPLNVGREIALLRLAESTKLLEGTDTLAMMLRFAATESLSRFWWIIAPSPERTGGLHFESISR